MKDLCVSSVVQHWHSVHVSTSFLGRRNWLWAVDLLHPARPPSQHLRCQYPFRLVLLKNETDPSSLRVFKKSNIRSVYLQIRDWAWGWGEVFIKVKCAWGRGGGKGCVAQDFKSWAYSIPYFRTSCRNRYHISDKTKQAYINMSIKYCGYDKTRALLTVVLKSAKWQSTVDFP